MATAVVVEKKAIEEEGFVELRIIPWLMITRQAYELWSEQYANTPVMTMLSNASKRILPIILFISSSYASPFPTNPSDAFPSINLSPRKRNSIFRQNLFTRIFEEVLVFLVPYKLCLAGLCILSWKQLKYRRIPFNSINLQKVTEIKRLRRSTRAQHDPLIITRCDEDMASDGEADDCEFIARKEGNEQ